MACCGYESIKSSFEVEIDREMIEQTEEISRNSLFMNTEPNICVKTKNLDINFDSLTTQNNKYGSGKFITQTSNM